MSYYLSVANQESSQLDLIQCTANQHWSGVNESHLDLIHDTAHQESLISHLELIVSQAMRKSLTFTFFISQPFRNLSPWPYSCLCSFMRKSLTLTSFMSQSIRNLSLTLFMAYSIIQKSLISYLDLIPVTVHEKITHLGLTHNIDHGESLTLTLFMA